MSFGCSIGDVISLTQLAWNTVQNSRKACGEHDEITREVSSLHIGLKRLEKEVARPESPIIKPGDSCREEIEVIAGGCRRVLRILGQVLTKYNALSKTERSGRKLWQKIKFGNGQMADLADFRSKIVFFTSAISLYLNMISIGTMGSVEKQMNDAGGELKEIKQAVNGITAHLIAKGPTEGSVLTAYPVDDRAIWRELRRELVADGFSSSVIGKHKHLIKAYIRELGDRGLLDDAEPQAVNGPSADELFDLENTSTLTTSVDAGTADSKSSTLPAAEKEVPYVHIIQVSTEKNVVSLRALEMQSNTEPEFPIDTRWDIESNVQLTKGIADVEGVASLKESVLNGLSNYIVANPYP